MARRLKYFLELWDTLEDAGVAVIILDPPLDSSTAVGRLIRNVLGAIAEFERDLFVERGMGGRRRKIGQGTIYLPRGKYGYHYHRKNDHTHEDPRITINESEAKVIERIFRRRAATASFGRIATELVADRVPTPGGATAWSATQVACIVHDRAYMGKGEWGVSTFVRTEKGTRVRRRREAGVRGNRPIAMNYPPILSDELWRAANAIEGRAPAVRASVDKYLLTGGMVRCREHGHVMTGSSGNCHRMYYRCGRYTGMGGRTSHSVPAIQLDNDVWQRFTAFLLDPALARAAAQQMLAEAEQTLEATAARRLEIVAALADLDRRATWMLTEGARTGAPASAIEAAMAEIAREQDQLRPKISNSPRAWPWRVRTCPRPRKSRSCAHRWHGTRRAPTLR